MQWEDGHKSAYGFKWLKRRSFNQKEQQKWLDSQKAPYKTWLAKDFKSIPHFDYQAIIKDDFTLLEWLQTLDVWGVSLINNVPNSLGHVGSLANRVGFIKKTHYGYVFVIRMTNDLHSHTLLILVFREEYSVQAKANATNVAYTSGYLQLHTDLPYYEYKPGVANFFKSFQNTNRTNSVVLS